MPHGPIPDKPEQLVAETEMLLEATATAEDFDRTMQSISTDAGATPEEVAALSAQIMDLAAERRKHPVRRFNAKRQEVQIDIGEWMLETFPFLRPPAEWLVERLDRMLARWSR